jgi:hypothetical protein
MVPAKPALHVQLARLLLAGKLFELSGHDVQSVEFSEAE